VGEGFWAGVISEALLFEGGGGAEECLSIGRRQSRGMSFADEGPDPEISFRGGGPKDTALPLSFG